MTTQKNWNPFIIFVIIVFVAGMWVKRASHEIDIALDAHRIEIILERYLHDENASSLIVEGQNPDLRDLVLQHVVRADLDVTDVQIEKHGSAAKIKVTMKNKVKFKFDYDVSNGLVTYEPESTKTAEL